MIEWESLTFLSLRRVNVMPKPLLGAIGGMLVINQGMTKVDQDNFARRVIGLLYKEEVSRMNVPVKDS